VRLDRDCLSGDVSGFLLSAAAERGLEQGSRSTMIVPGVEINCRNQSRFVLPSEPESLRTPVAMRGVPYDRGGGDSLERFDDKIKRGFIAGNIGGFSRLSPCHSRSRLLRARIQYLAPRPPRRDLGTA
jgi:hypothetical protein